MKPSDLSPEDREAWVGFISGVVGRFIICTDDDGKRTAFPLKPVPVSEIINAALVTGLGEHHATVESAPPPPVPS